VYILISEFPEKSNLFTLVNMTPIPFIMIKKVAYKIDNLSSSCLNCLLSAVLIIAHRRIFYLGIYLMVLILNLL